MCLSPRILRLANGGHRTVGCCRCSQCRKAYQDGWIARLNEEIKQWNPINGYAPVVFFTLKYRADTIPCTYTVLSERGVYRTDEKPDCKILPFWYELKTQKAWPEQRRKVLGEWYSKYALVAGLQSRPADADDFRNKEYMYHDDLPRLRDMWCPDMPDFEPNFRTLGDGTLLYPDYRNCPSLSVADSGEPLLAVEHHTVRKKDVQDWLKRGRERFRRAGIPSRCKTTWTDLKGVVRPLPSSAITSIKYFITSEYGPRTFRPHYHGCIFGVTYEEFREFFADDWQEKFGDVEFSLFDPTRGALSYISKYCSKGNYEHPLCSKDYVYHTGAEYHSKHYEFSLASFGVDMACVTPTFHLISKGIGVCYAFSAEIQRYFGVRLSEYFSRSGKVLYSSTELDNSHTPSLPLNKCFILDDEFNSLSKCLDLEPQENGDIIVRKFDQNNNLLGESLIRKDGIIDVAFEDIVFNRKYYRTYASADYQGRSVPSKCLPCWHLIGLDRLVTPRVKTTCLSLPRYYRRYLIPPLASALREAALSRLHIVSPEDLSRAIRLERYANQDFVAFSSDVDYIETIHSSTTLRLQESSQRLFYRGASVEGID